jgi:hypothetical protein
MPEFEEPTFVIDEESPKYKNLPYAKIGQPVKIAMITHPDRSTRTVASGVRTDDGMFTITVTTADGIQTIVWNFETLCLRVNSK